MSSMQISKEKNSTTVLSKSYAAIGKLEEEQNVVGVLKQRTPTTFLEVFEAALNTDKRLSVRGKGKIGEEGRVENVERILSNKSLK